MSESSTQTAAADPVALSASRTGPSTEADPTEAKSESEIPFSGVQTECLHCKGLLEEPMLLPCAHVSCRGCIKLATGMTILATRAGAAAVCPHPGCGKSFTAADILGALHPIIPAQLSSVADAGTGSVAKVPGLGESILADAMQMKDRALVIDLAPVSSLHVDAVAARRVRDAQLATCHWCQAGAQVGQSIPLAAVHCPWCGMMCTACATKHSMIPYTAGHPTSAATSHEAKLASTMCGRHKGRVVRGVCLNAACMNTLVCEDCLTFGDHRGHTPQLLADFEAATAEKTQPLLETVTKEVDAAMAALASLISTEQSIVAAREIAVKDINHCADRIKSAVDIRAGELKAKVKQLFSGRERYIQLQQAALTAVLAGSRHTLAAASTQLQQKLPTTTWDIFRFLQDRTAFTGDAGAAWVGAELGVDLTSLEDLRKNATAAGLIEEYPPLNCTPPEMSASLAPMETGRSYGFRVRYTIRTPALDEKLVRAAGRPHAVQFGIFAVTDPASAAPRVPFGSATTCEQVVRCSDDITKLQLVVKGRHVLDRVPLAWCGASAPATILLPNMNVQLLIWGAGGAAGPGGGAYMPTLGSYGGAGGYVSATMSLKPGEKLVSKVGNGGVYEKTTALGGEASYIFASDDSCFLGAGGGGGGGVPGCGTEGGQGGQGCVGESATEIRFRRGATGSGCVCNTTNAYSGSGTSASKKATDSNSNGADGGPSEPTFHHHGRGGGCGGPHYARGCTALEVKNATSWEAQKVDKYGAYGGGGSSPGGAGQSGCVIIVFPSGATVEWDKPGDFSHDPWA